MKTLKCTLLIALSTLVLFSCKEDLEADLYEVSVQLIYPEDYTVSDSVLVFLGDYSAYSDSTGLATFEVPAGTYTISASETRPINGSFYNFNASTSVSVATDLMAELSLSVSKSSQLIIKELYIGGCPKDDGSGTFTRDAYIILYNNSELVAEIDTNVCLAFAFPYNSNSTNKYLDENGNLTHEDWIPASVALWHFQTSLSLQAGEQILIPIYQAIDHTGTYSKSVDLSDSENFPMYDVGAFDNTSYYAAPSEKIPTSHYLNAIKYGIGSAWPLSSSSPAIFLFATEDMGPAAFAADAERTDYYGGSSTQVSQKVPIDWVIDAVDVFRQGYNDSNNKRFPDNIDAGYVTFTNGYGYSVYRNVDQEATEAIAENEGLLVYNYSNGTDDLVDGSTDASGIDAEASIANGARIIYKDSNNSSYDFHQRAIVSIK